VAELEKRLRLDLRRAGDFSRIHPMPQSGQDVPDDYDARLVVLGTDHPYHKDGQSPAEAAAQAILESRGNTPRLYRNTLVFLAADKTRLQDLDEAARKFLAWDSILDEKLELNLDPQQVKQAETQRASADSVVTARLPETYQWLLVPAQATPQSPVTWQPLRLTGSDALAVRASKKLRNDELLLTAFGPSRLRMELDRVPLWRGQQVAVKQLAEDFARYLYLPRLTSPAVLVEAIQGGVALLTWTQDSFAYAESYDEAAGRYRGLRAAQNITLSEANLAGLLVHPDAAQAQQAATPGGGKVPGTGPLPDGGSRGTNTGGSTKGNEGGSVPPALAVKPKRFHGSVKLDPRRAGRDAGKISEEVIAHLAGLLDANVTVTLEIEASVPGGVPDHVVRTVTENSRTLKFTSQGFESE